MAAIKPNLQCPVHPGLYNFKNATLDISLITNVSVEHYTVKTKFRLLSGFGRKRKELYSADLEVYFIRKQELDYKS